MERKEAIERLNQLRLDYTEFWEEIKNETTEALDIAISSLETDEAYQLEYEPTTKNDLGVDAVSRQSVLDLIVDYDLSMGQVVKGIHALPSVTPIRPKGHWISHREHCEMNNLRPSGLGSYFWCSECDCGIDNKNFSRVNYNYCPTCGAKMREVEDGKA